MRSVHGGETYARVRSSCAGDDASARSRRVSATPAGALALPSGVSNVTTSVETSDHSPR